MTFRGKFPACAVSILLAVNSVGCRANRLKAALSPVPIPPPIGRMDASNVRPGGFNLLKNGDFEEGVFSPWLPAVSSPAQGTFEIRGGKACATIESSGAQPFDVLLRQRPISIRRHREYVMRMTTWASGAAKLRPQIVLVGTPPEELWSAVMDIGPSEQTWATRFKVTVPTNSDAEFVIHYGGALQRNAPVTVCVDDIALLDEEQTEIVPAEPVPKVRVNLLGYAPKFSKIAVVKTTLKTPVDWALLDANGSTLWSGKTKVIGEAKDAGEFVHHIDFTKYQTEGRALRLRVGHDESDAFDITRELFRKLKYDALAFFYHQRSGIAIEMPYAGAPTLVRPAGHLQDKRTPCSPGQNCKYVLDASGGWYDAGDHGKYVVNGGVSVWTLLNLYERTRLMGTTVRDFEDGKLAIPEHENKIPDLLDEVRWELDFLMRMQVPEGYPLSGMAHHKLHDERWTAIPTAPQQDTVPRFLRPPSTAATLNLAAVGAQCARIYRDFDKAFADRCLTVAEKAWQAAKAHPNLFASSEDKEGGGPYGDTDISDETYWAAAELFVTTGKQLYQTALKQSPHYLKMPTQAGGGLSSFSWANVGGCGTISLAVVKNGLPASEVDIARKNIRAAAKRYVEASAANAYRVPFASAGGRYPWGSNSFILNNGIVLGLAYDLTRDPAYLEAASNAMDYILGRNPMAKSYVSAYGSRSLQNPHHRFWAHQANAEYPSPPPGVVSGGPNSGLEDPTAKDAGLGGCAPQKCYLDHVESWSTNEVAINWNAPLVWLTAFLDEKAKER